jgi:hypothetical protein
MNKRDRDFVAILTGQKPRHPGREWLRLIGLLLFLALMLGAIKEAASDPLPVLKNSSSSCPPPYYVSGSHCMPSPGTTRDIIPKSGPSCPPPWYVSGQYCVGPEKRRETWPR